MNQITRTPCLRQARFATFYSPLGPRYFANSLPARACQSNQQSKSNCQITNSSPSASPLSTFSRAFWACRSTWKRAGINTLRCLIGCTVGDFSALWALQSYYPELGMNTIMLASSASLTPRPLKIRITRAKTQLQWLPESRHPSSSRRSCSAVVLTSSRGSWLPELQWE